MAISFQQITEKNFDECVRLKVTHDQTKFVATNVMSIAQSKIAPHLIPLAIYNDDKMVGFTLYGKDSESKKYYIVRLMIDEKFQGKGYGKQATLKLIEMMKRYDGCDAIYLFFVPGNTGAETLYTDLGFERTGFIDPEDGEIEMRLGL